MSVQVLCIGDNVVDRYPQRGVMYPGGNAVNVAVHVRRCGAISGYIGAVGSDAAGQLVTRSLSEEAVDLTRLRTIDGNNAYAVVHLVDGNRVFGSGDVGVSRFVLDHDDLLEAARADLVHTGECSMIEDQLPELGRHSHTLSFDFSERPWEYVEAHARHVDLAVLSRPDMSVDEARDEARRVLQLGPRAAAVTLGPLGAFVAWDGEGLHAQVPSGPIVDTLGAGDAFIARLLVGVVRREDVQLAAAAATTYATASCATFGAFNHEAPDPDSRSFVAEARSEQPSLHTNQLINPAQGVEQ